MLDGNLLLASQSFKVGECVRRHFAPNPKFSNVEISEYGRKPAEVILMRVSQSYHIQLLKSSPPQVWR